MFLFFVNLFLSLFTGVNCFSVNTVRLYGQTSILEVRQSVTSTFNDVVNLVGHMFTDTGFNFSFNTYALQNNTTEITSVSQFALLASYILAFIVCICLFWVIVRSIYRLFQFLTFER